MIQYRCIQVSSTPSYQLCSWSYQLCSKYASIIGKGLNVAWWLIKITSSIEKNTQGIVVDVLPRKPLFQYFSCLLRTSYLSGHPANSVGDSVDMCVHCYATHFSPGKVHNQVSHFRPNPRERHLGQEVTNLTFDSCPKSHDIHMVKGK